jgi:hypothetical protein
VDNALLSMDNAPLSVDNAAISFVSTAFWATLIKSTFCRNPKTETRKVYRLRHMALQITRILVPKFPFNL